jgi:hypothetical protein
MPIFVPFWRQENAKFNVTIVGYMGIMCIFAAFNQIRRIYIKNIQSLKTEKRNAYNSAIS